VQDQSIRRQRPLRWRHCSAQLLLDDFGIVRTRDANPVRHPKHVSVDGKAGHSKRVAEDDVGGLAADAGQFHEFRHRARHLAAMTLDAGRGHSKKGTGLRAKEPGRLDLRLEIVSRSRGKRAGVGITREKRGRDLVHAFVGTLRGEDRGDEQLVGVREMQFRIGVRVLRPELRHDAADIGGGLRRRRHSLAAGRNVRHPADCTAGAYRSFSGRCFWWTVPR
jgi:hypothetical protein